MSDKGSDSTRLSSTVRAVPMKITPRLSKLSGTPPWRNELKNPGPTCRPRE